MMMRPGWRKIRLVAPCAAFLTSAISAWAQESPELPAKTVTSAQPVTGEEFRFTKGKGPGRGNSYVARFEEDYSYLRDPGRSTDFFDPLKFLMRTAMATPTARFT
jgi:hypothetical protein